jgi:hypothetical protein
MSKRPFVWHASKFIPKTPFRYPWAVTLGKPEHLNDYENSFETLPEAHAFAMGMVSAEEAVSQ